MRLITSVLFPFISDTVLSKKQNIRCFAYQGVLVCWFLTVFKVIFNDSSLLLPSLQRLLETIYQLNQEAF